MNKNEIKVTLIGNAGVGKTCIIQRFIDNSFSDNPVSTISANSIEKEIIRGKEKYVLNIWDTAGQEKYQSLGKHFYKDAYIILLIYDITNQNSLDSLKKTWYPDVQIYAENCVVFGVIGNKADLYENEELADEDEAKEFAKEIGAIFYQVSAKNGENIFKLFETLLDKFLEKDVQVKVKNIEMDKEAKSAFNLNSKGEKKKKCC